MKFEVYEGALGCIENVLYRGMGSWRDQIIDMGYTPEIYYRLVEFEDGTHIDFGSWSVFVRLIPTEK